ncbi:MAG: hypothetical protein PHT75_05005 [Bacilli bacterium]|nr:hypothetical protein [Bacilli bacterium]
MRTLIIFFKLHLKVVYFFIKFIPVNKNKITFLSRQSNNKSLDFKLLEKELLITKSV